MAYFWHWDTWGVTREWSWWLETYGSIKHRGHLTSKGKLISQRPECSVTFTNIHRLVTSWGLSLLSSLFVSNKSHCCCHGSFSISQYITSIFWTPQERTLLPTLKFRTWDLCDEWDLQDSVYLTTGEKQMSKSLMIYILKDVTVALGYLWKL